VVAAPDGRVRVNTVGTSWLGTAGSGDVLAGVCGSLLAAGLDPLDAGSVGAYLHATAGVLASRGGPLAAEDIARQLPEAYRLLRATP
jgi:ADP-dependent NAD(P)H-hydrate dehydratase / NAD(P)H-hydrate epimerase